MTAPYIINIEESILNDLKRRLDATRWTDEIENSKWELGTNKAYLKELCHYWQYEFDWRKQEAALNTLQHYKATVGDMGIHFIHEKGKGSKSVPLLLIHGYPDSFLRFVKIIPYLTAADENDFSFDVIIPSLPGYGFSDKPTEEGMNTRKIADLFAELMTKELGYKKFVAHGGDWGGSITEQLALYHESALLGIHLTDVPFGHGMTPLKDPSDKEKKFFEKISRFRQTEGAYAMIQSTKPQTLAYGLNDSPAGLAAWVIEKFKTWSDNDGDIENAFSKDELLTNVTVYWVTETINSAIRIYYETMKTLMQEMYNPLVKLNPFDRTNRKSKVSAAFALFPKDISTPPEEYANRFFTIERWTEMSEGGHFGAMEQPKLLANDIRSFASRLDITVRRRFDVKSSL